MSGIAVCVLCRIPRPGQESTSHESISPGRGPGKLSFAVAGGSKVASASHL